MKSNRKRKDVAIAETSFSKTILKISYRFSLAKVFYDFLTMSIAACTRNTATGLSHYEDEYLQTIATYKDSELRHEFPKAFARLIIEMEERAYSDVGNDVLGEFFEQHLSHGRNGQFFTPYPICQFIASAVATNTLISNELKDDRPLRILDPACGSGRMLLAVSKMHGNVHHYYGIDIDNTCVKMAALNLFLNGRWHSEVMCADALRPDDFVYAYRISQLPLGIFKIEEKEKSVLWNMHQNSFNKKDSSVPSGSGVINKLFTDGSQLTIF